MAANVVTLSGMSTSRPRLAPALLRGAVFGTIQQMSNAKKILAGMRKNPRDWRIEDLE